MGPPARSFPATPPRPLLGPGDCSSCLHTSLWPEQGLNARTELCRMPGNRCTTRRANWTHSPRLAASSPPPSHRNPVFISVDRNQSTDARPWYASKQQANSPRDVFEFFSRSSPRGWSPSLPPFSREDLEAQGVGHTVGEWGETCPMHLTSSGPKTGCPFLAQTQT